MILSQTKINKFSLYKTQAKLIGLSLIATVGIFSLNPQLANAKAIKCAGGADNTGVVCGPMEETSRKSPFGDNADIVQGILLALNIAIVAKLLWNGYHFWLNSKTN